MTLRSAIIEKERICDLMRACKTVQQLRDVWTAELDAIVALRAVDSILGMHVVNLKDHLKPVLRNDPARQAP